MGWAGGEMVSFAALKSSSDIPPAHKNPLQIFRNKLGTCLQPPPTYLKQIRLDINLKLTNFHRIHTKK